MHEYKAERFFIGLNNKFRSMWDAYEELKDTPHDITPVLENETFKNLKGLKINQDIDYDLVALESIFKKYKNINLLYSGGADSHTIAVKARQLGLKFKKTLTIGAFTDKWDPRNRNWYNKGIHDFFKNDDSYEYYPIKIEDWERVLDNPNWMHRHVDPHIDPCGKLIDLPVYSDDDLYVGGQEDPQLFYRDNQWYLGYFHFSIINWWHVPNVYYFFGINKDHPEIAISSARKIRDLYVSKFGQPTKKQFIFKTAKGHNDNFINEYNKAMGRVVPTFSEHAIRQTIGAGMFNRNTNLRASWFFDQYREDLLDRIINGFVDIYKKYPTVKWDIPMFKPTSKFAWLVNIDTLEYIPADQTSSIIN